MTAVVLFVGRGRRRTLGTHAAFHCQSQHFPEGASLNGARAALMITRRIASGAERAMDRQTSSIVFAFGANHFLNKVWSSGDNCLKPRIS